MISIITATYNSEKTISQLISSLQEQQCGEFEWIVVDGGSSDRTLDLVNGSLIKNKKIISEPDFGIYDAINKGLKVSEKNYYLVVGSDDTLSKGAINTYEEAIGASHCDIITASVISGGKVRKVRGGSVSRNRQFAYVSAHSVGTIFKKNLHDALGYYSKKFPIAADQLFILQAVDYGATIYSVDDVVGEFGRSGVSSMDKIGSLTESYRIQLFFDSKLKATLFFYTA